MNLGNLITKLTCVSIMLTARVTMLPVNSTVTVIPEVFAAPSDIGLFGIVLVMKDKDVKMCQGFDYIYLHYITL